MTLSAKISNALADVIQNAMDAAGITTTAQPALTATDNSAYSTRIVCKPGGCSERQTLRGIYDVKGEVVALCSVDIENAIATNLRLCDTLRVILGDRDAVAAQIMSQDPTIHIYERSWHLDGLDDDAGNRGFSATFSWRAVARDTITTE